MDDNKILHPFCRAEDDEDYEPEEGYDWDLDYNLWAAIERISRVGRIGDPEENLQDAMEFIGLELESMGGGFARGNRDNVPIAINALRMFMHNFCVAFPEDGSESRARCNECEFRADNGQCLIAIFATNHQPQRPSGDSPGMNR